MWGGGGGGGEGQACHSRPHLELVGCDWSTASALGILESLRFSSSISAAVNQTVECVKLSPALIMLRDKGEFFQGQSAADWSFDDK